MTNPFPKKCPTCGESLNDIPKYINSKWFRLSVPDWPLWICSFECSQSNCESKVLCVFKCKQRSGEGYTWTQINFESAEHHNLETNGIDVEMIWIHPAQQLPFEQPEMVPKEIRELLTEAFACLSSNKLLGACAYGRTCVYGVLDDQNIDSRVIETKDDKQFSRELEASERLELLKAKYPLLAKYIESLKIAVWMGNDFLHQNIEWEYSEVLESLKTISQVIEKIYIEDKTFEKRFGQIANKRGQKFRAAKEEAAVS